MAIIAGTSNSIASATLTMLFFLNAAKIDVSASILVSIQSEIGISCGYTFQSVLAATQDMLGGAHLMPSLPLILEALKQQTCGSGQPPHVCKRPRIAVDAVPMDYEALAKVSTACVMDEMAQGLGGHLLQ